MPTESMESERWDRIERRLDQLYPKDEAAALLAALRERVASFAVRETGSEKWRPSEKDACLVCYANSIESSEAETPPLSVLRDFIRRYQLAEDFPVVHLLPFCPYDTDRGFSVCDYRRVDPHHGDWTDVAALAEEVRLMFDFVANHASVENPLIQSSLIERHLEETDRDHANLAPYKDFVIAFDEDDRPAAEALASLARPRAAPVLTPYVVAEDGAGIRRALLGNRETAGLTGYERVLGSGWVWSTFSRGVDQAGREATRQVDLNYRNPRVFLEAVDILLFYVSRGARIIRLDAIGYLWKKPGSSSLHEEETHELLKTLYDVLALAAPGVLTIAEVNEPQDQVFAYLGSGEEREADQVYQFTHFPLAIQAVLTGRADRYASWLATTGPASGRQFVTVLGSHDGLGLKPVRGILPEEEVRHLLTSLVEEHGGRPNYAVLPGGERIVYEVCATPWQLINNLNRQESFETRLARYRVVVALGLMVRGMPAIYLNGLIGARNYEPGEGLDENRTVNREVFRDGDLVASIDEESGEPRAIFAAVRELLRARRSEPALAPDAPVPEASVLAGAEVLRVWLPAREEARSMLALVNVSARAHHVETTLPAPLDSGCADLWTGESFAGGEVSVGMLPYQVRWLRHR